MKIFCDYCGNQFDTAMNNKCPSCGADYSDDNEIKAAALKQAQEESFKRHRENIELRERQARIEDVNTKNANRKAGRRLLGIGCIIPIVLFSLCFTAIFIVALVEVINERSAEYKESESSSVLSDYEYESVFEEEEEEVPVSGEFNEAVHSVNYSVICDSFEEVDRYPFEPTDGYMYVSFHIVVKNTGIGKVNTTNDIICLADGMLASYTWHSDRKELPSTTLPAGVSAEGYICFEVPVDTEEFELRYGEYVTIYIENTLDGGSVSEQGS